MKRRIPRDSELYQGWEGGSTLWAEALEEDDSQSHEPTERISWQRHTQRYRQLVVNVEIQIYRLRALFYHSPLKLRKPSKCASQAHRCQLNVDELCVCSHADIHCQLKTNNAKISHRLMAKRNEVAWRGEFWANASYSVEVQDTSYGKRSLPARNRT